MQICGLDLLLKEHDKGVCLLAGAASGDPYPDGLIGAVATDQIGNDLIRQDVEHLRVAEEAGDMNQQILGQKLELAGITSQKLDVAIHATCPDRHHRHASLDAPLQCAGFVEPEVVAGLRSQQVYDLMQPTRFRVVFRQAVLLADMGGLPVISDDCPRDLPCGQHKVDRSALDRAPRHTVKVCLVRILRDDEAISFLDDPCAKAAVSAHPGKDDTDRALADVVRQRTQQEIEGQARAVTLTRGGNAKRAALDRKIDTGRNRIDGVGLNQHTVGRLLHRQGRVSAQQIDHHALVCRIEVLNDDKGHAAVRRQRSQELLASVETARGCPHRDDWKVARPPGVRGSRRRAAAVFRFGRL